MSTEQRKLEEKGNAEDGSTRPTDGASPATSFNNLLTVILGCSEFIGDEVKDERLKKMVEMIAGAARRGAAPDSPHVGFCSPPDASTQRHAIWTASWKKSKAFYSAGH